MTRSWLHPEDLDSQYAAGHSCPMPQLQDPLDGIGHLLRTRRLALGLSQQALATKAGVATRTLARIEGGEDVRLGTLVLLATALDTTAADLLTPQAEVAS